MLLYIRLITEVHYLWQEYAKGKTPHEIFKNAGIHPSIIGSKNPARCLERWRISYFKDVSKDLMVEKHDTSNSGRPVTSELSLEEIKIRKTKKYGGTFKKDLIHITFVLNTLYNVSNHCINENVIIHSDQEVHYTSNYYRTKIEELDLIASMSTL